MGLLKTIPRPYLYLMLVGLAAILVFWLEGPTRERKGDILNRPLLENFAADAVARIEIEHLLSGVQLEKKEGQWQVAPLRSQLQEELEKRDNGPRSPVHGPLQWGPADAEKIDLTLSILQDVLLTSLAGTNPERHGFFEVNQAGMQVRFFDAKGNKLAHLYIGKAGPAFTESYLRKEGDDKVYLANRYLRGSFSIEPDDWRRNKEESELTPKDDGSQ